MTDEARLDALSRYDILDTGPEAGFDDVVQLARLICDAPVSLVSFVARDRQWFKARAGFEGCETDLDRSVCAHALAEPDLLVIEDLTQDPRTAENSLVTDEPGIRFYAGAPLRTPEGHALGSLCVIDSTPRPGGLTEAQAEALRVLARQVMSQLELRRAIAEREGLLDAGRLAGDRRAALLDLGDRLRDEESVANMIAVVSSIVGRALGASRVGFGYLDDGPEHIDIVSDWTVEGQGSIVGRHRFSDYGDLLHDIRRGEPLVIDDVTTDPRTAADPGPMLALGIATLVNMPVRERGRTVALLIVHDVKPRAWTVEVLAFLRNVAERLQTSVARLNAEAEQRVLNDELSHRMKNMMAMIQAIATQTLKGLTDREPVMAFEKRLHALSQAHDVLLAESWTSARLASVAEAALSVFAIEDRLTLSGPDVELGPRATLSVSLLLHELATNAIKHGALSSESGRIALDWRVAPDDGPGVLLLEWTETGGPRPGAPTRRGFGSRLISMGLIGTGRADIQFRETGLVARFDAPIDQVQAS